MALRRMLRRRLLGSRPDSTRARDRAETAANPCVRIPGRFVRPRPRRGNPPIVWRSERPCNPDDRSLEEQRSFIEGVEAVRRAGPAVAASEAASSARLNRSTPPRSAGPRMPRRRPPD